LSPLINGHIWESNMDFGELNDKMFYIEASDLYERKLRSKGIRTVEFLKISYERKRIYFVEAKTSFPDPNSIITPENFDLQINQIAQKFYDALLIFISICHGNWRNKEEYEKLPSDFKKNQLQNLIFTFVLIVKNSKLEWTKNIKDALDLKIKKNNKAWYFDLAVLNETEAKKLKFIE